MKRGGPLRRNTPLKPSREKQREWKARAKPIQRSARIAPVNAERAAKRFEAAYGSEARCAFVRGLGCVVPLCTSAEIEVAHVRSRGAGGKAADTVPLCHAHHRESHDAGLRTFEARYGLDLTDLAGVTELRWRERTA